MLELRNRCITFISNPYITAVEGCRPWAPSNAEWQTKILPTLKKITLKSLAEKSGMSRRALIDARAGRSRPHRKNRERLVSILKKLGLI